MKHKGYSFLFSCLKTEKERQAGEWKSKSRDNILREKQERHYFWWGGSCFWKVPRQWPLVLVIRIE
jgi:hypothetical protein